MAVLIKHVPKSATKAPQPVKPTKPTTTKLPYDMPEKYRDKFYLANAAFFDRVNWFLHHTYEQLFKNLRYDLHNLEEYRECSIDETIDKMNDIVKILDNCNTLIDIRFPLRRNNGRLELIRGYKALYGLATGLNPCLGGFRFDEDLNRDQIKGFSALSMYKNACVGIGLSGSHGGVKINPKNYSENELRMIVEQYTAELYQKGLCGGQVDISHADVNTSQREMSWISNTYADFTGCQFNSASVGKGLENGGVVDFDNALSLGALYALEFFINNDDLMQKIEVDKGLKDKTFIIQGLGKMGVALTNLLVEKGAICVGIKEKNCYLYVKDGINLQELFEHIKQTGSMENYSVTKSLTTNQIYKEECDILIFAACHNSIICYEADKVKAKVVLEAADGPVAPSAHKVFTSSSKLVIPDLYACAGTSILSYVEFLKNMQLRNLSRENVLKNSHEIYTDIDKLLLAEHENKMIASSTSVSEVSCSPPNLVSYSIERILSTIGQDLFKTVENMNLGLDFRTAAYTLALERIYKKIFSDKKYT